MLRKLKLILWKNLLIRKRHWLLTFTEILIPILLFSLVAYGRSKISGLKKIHVEEPTYYQISTVEDIYSHLDVGDIKLWYSPYTDFTEKIITKVQEKLQIRGDAVQGFTSKENLLEHFEKNRTFTAAVNFYIKDLKKLNYELSIYDKYFSWDTDKLFLPMFLMEDTRTPKYMYKGFVALQVAIDMAFMELFLKEDTMKVDFNVQEFPDPPRTIDSGLSQLFMYFLPLITIFSFIFLCPAVLKRVGEEKHSGTKEFMKMVGMKPWMIWFGWFIHALITNLLSIVVIVILMKVPFWGVSYPPIEYADFTVLFTFLFLYCMACITFCFLIASVFNTPSVSTVIGILLWIFSYFVPQTFVNSHEYLPWKYKIPLAIFPNMALHYGYSSISVYEIREIGIQWNNIFQPGSGSEDDVTMGNVFLMLIFDMIAFMILTAYIENVKPGEYGIAKPYSFPITSLKNWMKKCCIGNQRVQSSLENESLNTRNFDQGKTPCIQIYNLHKKFYNHVAVDNLSLDIYKNHITILLGHNGAGKTTTMSILTGMISATSGHIVVDGKNIKKHTDEVRSNMGLCPQHNLLFPDLTVIEHLQFFAMLKGSINPREEAKNVLLKLGIHEKENDMAQTLSGGMKRKLCLGMALIGNSQVLILDEPTSGMDPESRRKVWDLLIQYRKSKTILVTTHFMEEADVLGDWIAIMANGRLQCYDTPMRLKIKYNTGYHLCLMLGNKKHTDEITEQIKKNIPEAQLIRESEDTLVYLLPLHKGLYGVNYRNVFKTLEDKKDEWGIVTIGLNLTTLNDVFLKAKDEIDGKDETDINKLQSEAFINYPDLKGVSRTWNNMYSLLAKRLYFLKKKYYWFIPSLLVAICILLLSVWLGMSDDSSKQGEPPLNLSLKIYGRTQVYFGGNQFPNSKVEQMRHLYREAVLYEQSTPTFQNDVSGGIIQMGVKNIAFYKRHMVVAAEFNNTEDTIYINSMYSQNTLHALPISINLAMNALIKTLLNESFAISTSNVPIKYLESDYNPSELSLISVMSAWLILIPISMLFFTSSFIVFPHTEVSTNFLRIQTIAGVKPYMYWFSNILFDMVFAVAQLALVFIALVLVNCLFYNSAAFELVDIVTILVIFLCYTFSSLPFTYLLSYRKTLTGGFTLLVMLGIFTGVIPTIVVVAMELSHQNYYVKISRYLKHTFFVIFPEFSLSYVIVKFTRKYVSNFNWRNMDPDKRSHICHNEPIPCCYGENTEECSYYKSYFLNNEMELLYDMFEMLIPFIIYFIILLFVHTEYFEKLLHYLKYCPDFLFGSDSENKKNNRREGLVSVDIGRDDGSDRALLVKNLTKTFGRKRIVKNLMLQLKKNKCFGLLGVNGAGKSTTFRMLTKNLFYDEGEITVSDGHPISIKQPNYCQSIGYCPQEDCLNYFLTGRELLLSVARLKGYSYQEAENVTNRLMEHFGLEEYAHKVCGEYSGGNKRKLSTCIAFLGFPKVILLDEPTSGVDPASRRNFWNILSSFKKNKETSFLLCSHSMEECENLCDEIAIMKDGEIKDQGSLLALKNKYQNGFKVVLKLKCEVDSVSSAVRDKIVSHLEADVLEEYGETLEYQVKNNTKTLDQLFESLEKLKEENDCIEDYVISQISLEDIFLNIAETSRASSNSN